MQKGRERERKLVNIHIALRLGALSCLQYFTHTHTHTQTHTRARARARARRSRDIYFCFSPYWLLLRIFCLHFSFFPEFHDMCICVI